MQPISYADNYDDFYIVVENAAPLDQNIKVLEERQSNTLNFIRFEACLQSFGKRNRNRRLWQQDMVRSMCEDKPVVEAIRRGSFVGEAGHPVAMNGQVTIERIFHKDPLRCSHRITSLDWRNNLVYGVVESLDEGEGSPGFRLMKNVQQGIIPAFSLRSIVPQRKNADGTIDVVGKGTVICWDRVYGPSHEEAYMNVNIPVKQIIKKAEFVSAMEHYSNLIISSSDKVRGIVDNMEPALETATYDTKSQLITMETGEGRVFIPPEGKYRDEIKAFMSSL